MNEAYDDERRNWSSYSSSKKQIMKPTMHEDKKDLRTDRSRNNRALQLDGQLHNLSLDELNKQTILNIQLQRNAHQKETVGGSHFIITPRENQDIRPGKKQGLPSHHTSRSELRNMHRLSGDDEEEESP